MSKRGKLVTFHGAFKSKKRAMAKERSVNGFIKRVKIRRRTRYVVMT